MESTGLDFSATAITTKIRSMDLERIFSLAGAIAMSGWLLARNQIPHLVVIPCLVMTFMLGPIGLLFYLAIRTAKTKTLTLENA